MRFPGWSLRALLLLATTVSALAGSLTPALAAMSFTTQGGWRQLPVPQYFQIHGLDCEAAALQMALAEQGIAVSQNTLLSQIGIDYRAPYWDASGAMHWGDPYANFVGNPDGAERLLTGYGVYYPPIARVAAMDGATVVRSGEGIAPATLYQDVLAGHPAIAWVSFDWKFHQVTHYVAFDGRTVQFGNPYEHSVVISGVSTDFLLINNPWFGLQWISKATFEPSYATFNDMAVVLGGSPSAPGPPSASSTYPNPTPAPQDTYHPLTPARIADTRDGTGGVPRAPISGGSHVDIPVLGRGGLPAAGVDAVVVNVTATDTTSDGFLTLYPSGSNPPQTSSVNWAPGATRANLATVAVGQNGMVGAFSAKGLADLVLDVEGWYGPGTSGAHDGLFDGLAPARLLDTRATGGPMGPGQQRDLQVTGRGGVPAAGVAAVVLNLTATGPSASGYLTVFPAGAQRPGTSNLNFRPGETVPNRVVVPVGSGGSISIFNPAGNVQAVVDVNGWFTDASSTAGGSEFAAVPPARILDTRQGIGALPPGATGTVQAAHPASFPVTALMLNVTIAGASTASFLTLWPDALGRPPTSDLNYTTGQTVANMVVAQLGSTDKLDFYNVFGTPYLVVDLAGYFGPVVPTA